MSVGYFLTICSVIWLFTVLFVKLPRGAVLGSLLLIWSSVLSFIFFKIGLLTIFYLFSVLLVLFCLLLSFYSDRTFNYLFALIFLILTPIFLIFKLEKVAEYLSSAAFLFLFLGFVRDTFYEKFIEG